MGTLSFSLIIRSYQSMTTLGARNVKVDRGYSPLVAIPNLHTIVTCCLIALLLTLNIIIRFPDLGILVEQYNQF